MSNDLYELLKGVKDGTIPVEDAAFKLKAKPFEDIGYAKVDLHRKLRQGAAEVIYGAGKTPKQIIGIAETMLENGQNTILITRLSEESAREVQKACPLRYKKDARCGIIGEMPVPDGIGKIVVATGGTSDIPVAEEAARTIEFFGGNVDRFYDVGVAGLHRLLSKIEEIRTSDVVIAVAGMEGALASVVAGLVRSPVIAVPTSVGYGASFAGVSALLSMLNSCAEGVCTVNIDNGFGAGVSALRMLRIGKR